FVTAVVSPGRYSECPNLVIKETDPLVLGPCKAQCVHVSESARFTILKVQDEAPCRVPGCTTTTRIPQTYSYCTEDCCTRKKEDGLYYLVFAQNKSKGPPGTPVCPAHPGAKVILGHYRTSAAPETAPAERLFTLPDFTSAE
ncbi:hypothetical protein PTTG_25236, partial [Puccinia triticina 1-1 BBBD Race 1]